MTLTIEEALSIDPSLREDFPLLKDLKEKDVIKTENIKWQLADTEE